VLFVVSSVQQCVAMGAGVDLQVIFAQGLSAIGALGKDLRHNEIEQKPNCAQNQSAQQAFKAAADEHAGHSDEKRYCDGEL
jgi:hypothetical protein